LAVEHRLDNLQRQQREAEQQPLVAALDPLGRGHLADRGITPLVRQPLVPERPGHRLHQRRVGTRSLPAHDPTPASPTVFLPGRRRMASGTRSVMLVVTFMPRHTLDLAPPH
jgi:hypothetical protein